MSIFHDRMLGPEMVAALNQLWAAFAASAYPPSGGMFPPGTQALPSVRGTADPSTGVNFPGAGVAELLSGGAVSAKVTPAGIFDALGNPLLSALNAVGYLSAGSVIERGQNANGDYVRFADGTQFCVLQKSVDFVSESAKQFHFQCPTGFVDSTHPHYVGVTTRSGYGIAQYAGEIQSFGAVVMVGLRPVDGSVITHSDVCLCFVIGRWK